MKKQRVLVCGSSGFIGQNLVERLMAEGYHVTGVDIKDPEFVQPDVFFKGDLRDMNFASKVIAHPYDRLYQLAADMGGAGFIFTGDNDADVMRNNAAINLNVAECASKAKVKLLFYSSSACVYPDREGDADYSEGDAYPANPDNDYGWEKLFSERLYLAYARNKGLNVRIARFHNTYGKYSTWRGGREKAPAAMCRKAIMDDKVEIWGDGEQRRSFTDISETLDGVEKLMQSDYSKPINIGSDRMVTINELIGMCLKFAGRNPKVGHRKGPVGMRDRNSDNSLALEVLGWKPTEPLEDGMRRLFDWINSQVNP